MAGMSYGLASFVETLLRMAPLPHRTGVIEIGNPDRRAPVLLTCNYDLTVRRVVHALQGQDCYLVVANSRGVNVWCAAAGGLFTHHDVISALKTSGIEARVDHRDVILPQFAAAGIEASEVAAASGWRVTWGPVEIRDLPAFREGARPAMRQVTFPLGRRLEMAAAWAFPISVFAALALLLFWRTAIVPVVLLVWAVALLVFAAFPLYAGRLGGGDAGPKPLGLDFAHGGIQAILWGLCLLGLVPLTVISGSFGLGDLLRWAIVTLAIVVVITIDLPGSTPVLKSGLYPDRFLHITLDEERCIADGACTQVCPRACFRLDPGAATVALVAAENCVQCGACIIQCPADALTFTRPDGSAIEPQIVRSHRTDLMGHRSKSV